MQGLKSLLISRKFWLTLLGLAGPIYMYATHAPGMTPQILAGLLVAAFAALQGGIAIEDHGAKGAPTLNAAGGDVVTNVAAPLIPADRPTVPALESSK